MIENNEDFSSVLNINVERKKEKYKLYNIMFIHYYFNSGDIEVGNPIFTSVELKSNYNYEMQKLEWNKIIKHSYYGYNDNFESIINEREEKLSDFELITELENIDLRDYKNNYFTDSDTDRFTHWEIHYNDYFSIVGTYDQEFKEVNKIKEILDVKNIIQEEIEKVKNEIDTD